MSKTTSVLLVEDDKYLSSSLFEQLTRELYDTKVANDGQEALDRLKENQFDLVILDLKLPKVNGFDVLQHIKTNAPFTKVIVLTSYADLNNVEKVKQLGADDVIEKPYDLGELFDAINFVMKKK